MENSVCVYEIIMRIVARVRVPFNFYRSIIVYEVAFARRRTALNLFTRTALGRNRITACDGFRTVRVFDMISRQRLIRLHDIAAARHSPARASYAANRQFACITRP